MDRLIGELGAADPTVIETMVAEYHAPVYRLALSILYDPEDAEDAAQETFIKAFAALHRYQVGTNFKAWLFKIAVNNCRMTLRKRAARRTLQQVWESTTNLVSSPIGTEAQVIEGETHDELWDLVDDLDEKHRLAVVLRLAHDLTVDEIGQVLGINKKTVYTRLYEAFARLRVQIRLRPELAYLLEEVEP